MKKLTLTKENPGVRRTKAHITSTFFILLSLIMYIKARTDKTKAGLYFGVMITSYFLGLMSKETAIMFPCIAIAYEMIFLTRKLSVPEEKLLNLVGV